MTEGETHLTIIKGISYSLNGPTNGSYDTEDPGHKGTVREPVNCLDDTSRASADEEGQE